MGEGGGRRLGRRVNYRVQKRENRTKDTLKHTPPFMQRTESFASEVYSQMIHLGMLGGALLGRLGA